MALGYVSVVLVVLNSPCRRFTSGLGLAAGARPTLKRASFPLWAITTPTVLSGKETSGTCAPEEQGWPLGGVQALEA